MKKKSQKLGLIKRSWKWSDWEKAFTWTCLNKNTLKTSVIVWENVTEMDAVLRAQHPTA